MLKYQKLKVLVQMVKSLNNQEILNKLDEIINEIETSEVYQKYLSLKR